MRIGSLFQGLAISSLALLGRADDCTDGLSGNLVFGEGTFMGQQFADSDKPHYCETRWKEGLIVNGIKVWSSKYNVQALQLRYSDGSWSKQIGSQTPHDYNYQEITWDSDVRVNSIKHRPNGKRDSAGQIEWTVDGQDTFKFGTENHWGGWIDANVHTGVFLGVWGKADGVDLSSMMLLFLKSDVRSATVTEMKFDETIDELNKKQEGIEEISVGEVAYMNENGDGVNATYTFKNTIGRTKQMSTSQSTSHTVSASTSLTVSGKAGVPLLAEGEVSASVAVGYEYSQMRSQEELNADAWTMEWSITNVLAPGRAAVCKATAYRGTYSGGYTSTVEALLGDGSKFTYQQKGTFDSIGYAVANATCPHMAISSVPSTMRQEKAAPVENNAVPAPQNKVTGSTKKNTRSLIPKIALRFFA